MQSDLDIKLINTINVTNVQNVQGHKKAITAISIDPNGDYLLSCGIDGQLNIFDLVETVPSLVKSVDNLIEKNSAFCSISWNLKKEHIAFPGKSKGTSFLSKMSQ